MQEHWWRVGCLLGACLCSMALLPQHAEAFAPSTSWHRSTSIERNYAVGMAAGVRAQNSDEGVQSGVVRTSSRREIVLGITPDSIKSISRRCLLASSFTAIGSFPQQVSGRSNPRVIEKELQMNIDYGSGNPRTKGFLLKRFTGDSTPFTFQTNPVRLVREWPDEMPFSKDDFSRMDESNDSGFYSVPRFVYHIDEGAVAALTQYYRKNIKPGSAILDICSSWVSHYPLEFPETMTRISGTGMNFFELSANEQFTDFKDKNLNIDPTLPYDDATFDVVTCVVSIDYLTKPIKVLQEVNRVLKPGGKIIISQSNRCFPTKAIKMWLEMNDRQHLELINAYIQYAGGFKAAEAFDVSARGPDAYDPMFIVQAEKQ